jgi:16S rRNA (adenine1518-N6/adenine1519-N6)-dimethyltransferase
VNGHTARKRFGQNFLHDQLVIARIVDAIHPARSDHLVEIGPGLAALTRPLAKLVDDLQLVEIDRDLAQRLRVDFPQLKIHQADALDLDFSTLGARLRLVGNLPYNISTPLLFHVSQFSAQIVDAHFMLQKEVVDRMVAEPGTTVYGRLSVMLQYRWQMQRLFPVAAECFQPVPQVQSAVVRLIPYATPLWQARSYECFAEVVAAAFGQRRKTLRNALKKLLPESEFAGLGVDSSVRAETLGVEIYVKLADRLNDTRQAGARQ